MKHFNEKTSKVVISHFTDIEGSLRYFESWLKRSNQIQLVDGSLSFRNYSSNQRFIFGGDVCDKGPGDLRIARLLVDFKKKYPLQVTLIAGNRDIKCRRFTLELLTDIRHRLLFGTPVFWNKKVSPKDYLIKQMQEEGINSFELSNLQAYLSNKSEIQCQTIYLKWMLKETMGCGGTPNKPDTFDYRRKELSALTGQLEQDITDEMVTQSFIDSVSPNGVIEEYLKLAQLGDIVGETLFIHGAVTPQNMGYVPGLSDSQARISDAKEWIKALNNWYNNQIAEWLVDPTEHHLVNPGNKNLEQYLIMNPKSMVTTNWYTNGKLTPIPVEVIDYLNNAGIKRVVTGHQPFSDFPLILRHPNLEVIVGDTSYSDSSSKEDNRGLALHNLEITQIRGTGQAFIDAIFKDGSKRLLKLPPITQKQTDQITNIGHFTHDGQLIRPLNGSQLCCSQLDGHQVINYNLPDELSSQTTCSI